MARASPLRAAGFLLILMPPTLLATASRGVHPALAFVVIMGALPMLRLLVGDAPERPARWSEPISIMLDALPALAALAFVISMATAVWALLDQRWAAQALFELGLSLWATCLLATCIAHELLHHRSPVFRGLGRIVSGVLGYPLLEHEHRIHHLRQGQVASAESPAVHESLWKFTGRRLNGIFRAAWEEDLHASVRNGHRLAGGLPASVGAWLATTIAFGVADGLHGLLLYGCVSATVAWAVQAMTYIQHWGLSAETSTDSLCVPACSWEDRCQLQAWITLGISFHQAHHGQSRAPYYRLAAIPGSPRLPGGYVVMLVAATVPPLWRAWMLPALRRWQSCRQPLPDTGRRLLCFTRQPP